MRWAAKRARWAKTARIVPVLVLALGAAALPRPAWAQFNWFGSGASSQDAYDTIAEHGFRLVSPMMQNRDVYIADVVDRRQRRQRLIISRESGQIVQRFMVDTGRAADTGRAPYAALPGSPYGGTLPPRQDGVFDRIVRGFNDDAAPRPPGAIGSPDAPDAVTPQVLPKPQRLTRPKPSDVEPRLATRHDDAPIASRPLTPEPAQATPPVTPSPSPAPAMNPVKPPPPAAAMPTDKPPAATQATAPQPAALPQPTASPPPARATVVSSDPLRIPGNKEPDAAKPAPAVAKAATPAKPAASKGTGDVPVAPLD